MQGEQSDRVPAVVDALVALGVAMKAAGEVGEVLDGPTPRGASGEPATALEVFVGDQAAVSSLTPLVAGGRRYVETIAVACRITAWGGDTNGETPVFSTYRTQISDVLKHLRDRIQADRTLGGVADKAEISSDPQPWSDESDDQGSALTLSLTIAAQATV